MEKQTMMTMAMIVRVRLMVLLMDMKVIIAIYRYRFGVVCHCSCKRNTVLLSDLVVFDVILAFDFHENRNNKPVNTTAMTAICRLNVCRLAS
jgi:hypothetical protein